MKIIPLASIKIAENRQRREFDPEALMQLTESINSKGLLHAPVIREVSGEVFLVAGERRLRAIHDLWGIGGKLLFEGKELEEGFIPVSFLGELSPLEVEEAELEENTVRADLSWQERADAEARLHRLRCAQAVQTGTKHTVSDTALEIHGRKDGWYTAEVRQSVVVSRHLQDEDVKKAKTLSDAYKVIKRKEERKKNAELAISVGRTFSVGSHTLLNQDSTAWLTAAPAGTYDVICTDPPYGMGADAFGDAGGALDAAGHQYRDDAEHWRALMRVCVPEWFRVAKDRAHLYIFCDLDHFHELRQMCAEVGWKVHRTPLVWHKRQAHRVPWPECGPRRTYELILFAIKGGKRVNFIGPDVITTDTDHNLGLAAQKPVAIFRELLTRSCSPGDCVLDSFCGTGPVFAAAHELKLPVTGLELNPATYAIALKRIGELK